MSKQLIDTKQIPALIEVALPELMATVSIFNYQLLRVEPSVAVSEGVKVSDTGTEFKDNRGWTVGLHRDSSELSFTSGKGGGYCFALNKVQAAWLAEQLLAFAHAPQ